MRVEAIIFNHFLGIQVGYNGNTIDIRVSENSVYITSHLWKLFTGDYGKV